MKRQGQSVAAGCEFEGPREGREITSQTKRNTCWPEQSLQTRATKEPPLKKPGLVHLPWGPGRYQQHLQHHVTILNAYSYLKMRGRTCWVIPGEDAQLQRANILTCPIRGWDTVHTHENSKVESISHFCSCSSQALRARLGPGESVSATTYPARGKVWPLFIP